LGARGLKKTKSRRNSGNLRFLPLSSIRCSNHSNFVVCILPQIDCYSCALLHVVRKPGFVWVCVVAFA